MDGTFCSVLTIKMSQSSAIEFQVLSVISKLRGTWAGGSRSGTLKTYPSNQKMIYALQALTQTLGMATNSTSSTVSRTKTLMVAPALAAQLSVMSKTHPASVKSPGGGNGNTTVNRDI